jgi:hypothetical protein
MSFEKIFQLSPSSSQIRSKHDDSVGDSPSNNSGHNNKPRFLRLTEKSLSKLNELTPPVSPISNLMTPDTPKNRQYDSPTPSNSSCRNKIYPVNKQYPPPSPTISTPKSPSPTIGRILDIKSKGNESVRTLVQFFSSQPSFRSSMSGQSSPVKGVPPASITSSSQRFGNTLPNKSQNVKNIISSSVDENREIAKTYKEIAREKATISRQRALEKRKAEEERQQMLLRYKEETKSRTSVESRLTATAKLLKMEKERLAIIEMERRIKEEERREKQRLIREKEKEEQAKLLAERKLKKEKEAAEQRAFEEKAKEELLQKQRMEEEELAKANANAQEEELMKQKQQEQETDSSLAATQITLAEVMVTPSYFQPELKQGLEQAQGSEAMISYPSSFQAEEVILHVESKSMMDATSSSDLQTVAFKPVDNDDDQMVEVQDNLIDEKPMEPTKDDMTMDVDVDATIPSMTSDTELNALSMFEVTEADVETMGMLQ